jgi:rhomboid family GlyGly-CTERM serine protease
MPWATLAAAALAVFVYCWPRTTDTLIFDRTLLLSGDWWRWLTGHWVHFSRSHLAWNLAVLVPAGIWCERIIPAQARWLFVLAPMVISTALFVADPELSRYAGLSGIAAAMLTLLALTQLRTGATDRWFWRTVLALLTLKIAAEAMLASPLFAHFPDATVRSVPLAHVAGMVTAAVVHWFAASRGRRSGREE